MLTDLLTLDRPIVGLDLETTGTDPERDRIVQVGVVKLRPDGMLTEWQTPVNPGVPLSTEVEAFFKEHGGSISNATLNACQACKLPIKRTFNTDDPPEPGTCPCIPAKPVPSFASLAPVLYAGLNGCDLAGYNLGHFDVPLLRNEFKRASISWTPGRIVDGYRLAARANPRNLTWFVETYLGKVDDFVAHDALHDARQSLRGIEAFLRRHTEFPRDVQKLHDMFFVDPRDSSTLDPDGKFAWRGDECVVNFGKKHKGKTLREVKALDPGFLRDFILKGDFNETVKKIAQEALEGRFPVRA